MAAESRTYIRVHDGMPDHPKVDALSDAAFRLLVTTWCWCSRYLTDGAVPAATWARRGTAKARRELIAAGLVDETPDGIMMHDYTDWQRTAVEVEALRAARQEAGSKGGKAKAKRLASARANGKQTGSKAVPESETERSTSAPLRGAAAQSITQRAKKITDAYAEVEPMCRWPAINGIVIKAIKAARWTDAEVAAAVLRLAKDGRTVSVETLRIELDGLTPRPSKPPTPPTPVPPSANGGSVLAELDAKIDAEQHRARYPPEGRQWAIDAASELGRLPA